MNVSATGHPRQFWVECEQQLFSMSAMDPEQYKQIVTAIRAVSDVLVEFETPEALHAAWPEAKTLYVRAAHAAGFDPNSLPHGKISGAAFAMRERKITEEKQVTKFATAITEARKAGQGWATLSETGDLTHGLLDPYSCTEMDLASGLAIVTITQPEPSGAGILYALSVVRLDRNTGQLEDAEPGFADWTDYSTVEDLIAARDALRTQIREHGE